MVEWNTTKEFQVTNAQANQHALIVLNPAAGGGRAARQWPALARRLAGAGIRYVVEMTQQAGDATEITRRALQAGTELIVAAGGDGTLNEVVNGFFPPDATDPILPHACLAVLPLGTGSDFARSIGVASISAAVHTLRTGHTRAVDLGWARFQGMDGSSTRRFFVNAADLGLGADVAERVNRHGKQLGPTISYLRGAVGAALAGRSHQLTLQFDDAPTRDEQMLMIVVANGRTFGGGLPIAPDAAYDDGMFDVVTLQASSRRTLLLDLLPRLYRARHLSHPKVRSHRATRISIVSATPLPLEVDGELVGTTPVEIELVPSVLPCLATR